MLGIKSRVIKHTLRIGFWLVVVHYVAPGALTLAVHGTASGLWLIFKGCVGQTLIWARHSLVVDIQHNIMDSIKHPFGDLGDWDVIKIFKGLF